MAKDDVTNLNKKSIVIKFYRIERWLWVHRLRFLSKIMWRLLQLLFACVIPPTTVLEDGVDMPHAVGIVIHQNSIIGKNTLIYQNVTIGSGKGPKIGADCIIGAGACVLGDITIGNNVKIGANAVILKSIPDNCTVVGVPGKIIKRDCWRNEG